MPTSKINGISVEEMSEKIALEMAEKGTKLVKVTLENGDAVWLEPKDSGKKQEK